MLVSFFIYRTILDCIQIDIFSFEVANFNQFRKVVCTMGGLIDAHTYSAYISSFSFISN